MSILATFYHCRVCARTIFNCHTIKMKKIKQISKQNCYRSPGIFVPFTMKEYTNRSQLAELHYTALLDQSNRQAAVFSIVFFLFFLEGLLPHGVCLNRSWDCSTLDISFPFRIEFQSYALPVCTFWKHSLCFLSYVKICIEIWVRMSESWVSFTHNTFK